jgi:D-xylose transport system substrate-binding protein
MALAVSAWGGHAAAAGAAGTVYFLAPGQQDAARWLQQDAPAFSAKLKELAPGLSVEVLDANMDTATQDSQVQTAITKGAKAIVLVSVDENATGGILTSAAAAKVPVVLYDHNALHGAAAARVFYDFFQTGQLQGQALVDDIANPKGPFQGKTGPIRLMRVFIAHGVSITEAFAAGQDAAWKPLVDAGKLKVVCDDWAALGGDPFDKQIQQLAEQCLTRNNNGVDAALSLNDQFATYVMAALNSAGLLGKVPVYGGQDADLSGLQNIIRGYQTATVFKPQLQQAQIAAEVVASLVTTGGLPAGKTYETQNNGTADIPVVKLQASLVRKDDIHKVVEAGIYTWNQICVGDVASDPVCQKR